MNRVPGPRDPKKLPDPGFQTTQKLPPRPLPHSETTGLLAQQGQSRHCSVLSRDVNRVPGPQVPKKLPDPGFQTTRKLPPRPLPHSKTTGLPAQQRQSRHCSVLSETVATVSLRWSHLVHPYRRAHTTLGRHQSHHVTDHVLGRVDYSGW